MLQSRNKSKRWVFLCLAFLLNFSSVSFPSLVQAQTDNSSESLEIPDRRKGGGGRDGEECLASNKPLTALIPKYSLGKDYLAGTAAVEPKLFFYIPPLVQPREVELVLRDANDKLVYEKRFQLNSEGGIFGLQLPTGTKLNHLKINGDYHWYFSIICNPKDRAKDLVVEGLIRQISLDQNFAQRLEQVTSLEKVKLYQQAELWQETLTTLAELKRSQPNNLDVIELWSELLKSVELNPQIAQEPMINN